MKTFWHVRFGETEEETGFVVLHKTAKLSAVINLSGATQRIGIFVVFQFRRFQRGTQRHGKR